MLAQLSVMKFAYVLTGFFLYVEMVRGAAERVIGIPEDVVDFVLGDGGWQAIHISLDNPIS